MKSSDNTVITPDVVFEKGSGAVLTDKKGKKYIDLLAGVAVNLLGYGDKGLLKVINTQVKKYVHISRLFENVNQEKLAKQIIDNSFGDKVYFVNSGAEANEVAIKLARKWGMLNKNGAYEVITMFNSFHGRTIAALSATGQKKFHTFLKPKAPGFKYAKFNDIKDIRKKITKKTAAVMIEPLQAEGGVNVADKKFMKELSALCRQKKVLLIVDEVQTGMGRTGAVFCHQHYGIKPDIMTLGKGLGGGFPLSAVVASKALGKVFTLGDHGTTMGGNPVACAAGNYVFSKIKGKAFLNKVKANSDYLKKKIAAIKTDRIKEIRGMGFIIGVEFKKPEGVEVVKKALKQGLIINCPKPNIIRIVPPLVITKGEIDKAVKILEQILK